jgi:hypothetical protein
MNQSHAPRAGQPCRLFLRCGQAQRQPAGAVEAEIKIEGGALHHGLSLHSAQVIPFLKPFVLLSSVIFTNNGGGAINVYLVVKAGCIDKMPGAMPYRRS